MSIELSTRSEVGETGLAARIDRTAYLAHLLSLPLAERGSPLLVSLPWLAEMRENARARVQELAIPSSRDENWRFTDLSPLLNLTLTAPAVGELTDIPVHVAESQARLVFVNGQFFPQTAAMLSQESLTIATAPTPENADQPSQLWLGNLAAALENPALADRLQSHLAKQSGSEEVFTALNTASFADIAVIWVPRQVIVDTPTHILYISQTHDIAQAVQPRCWVIAEDGSQITIVEEYLSMGTGAAFNNAVTEIWLGENATVNHTRIQQENLSSIHIGKTVVSQARDSSYTCNAVTWGGSVSRHNLEISSQGEQTQTVLNGLTRIQGQQVADTHSVIAHSRPYASSRQIHKCLIGDRAHAVFNGRVCVSQAAQLTDAAQLNRNLLLSPRARVDTKPQLEIVADNVKCSHGATVSQLEQDEIFYLQSRGLSRAAACELLVYAFATDVLTRIPVASVRDRLIQQLAIVATENPSMLQGDH